MTTPHRARLLALVVTLLGCFEDRTGDGLVRVACLGDSNTAVAWDGSTAKWCEMMPLASSHERVNLGAPFASAGGTFGLATLDGPEQAPLAVTLGADIAVLAFITNDVGVGRTPAEIVTALRTLRLTLTAAGRQVYILAAPLRRTAPSDDLVAANAAVAAAFPHVIPHPALEPADYADEIHVGPSGQAKRAVAVFAYVRDH